MCDDLCELLPTCGTRKIEVKAPGRQRRNSLFLKLEKRQKKIDERANDPTKTNMKVSLSVI